MIENTNLEESINKRQPDGIKYDGQAYRVVIVDDSAVMRKMISQILKSEAYDVVGEAENGAKGVEMYETLKPDVITLDINMPEMSGVEALEKIISADQKAKCVMLTSESQKETVMNAIKKGAKDYITKPPDRRMVLEKIKSVLV